MKKIGIMGGTFNPIHYGHLMIAEEVRVEFKLDKILFIPSLNPPHKHNLCVPAQHRYKMTELAIRNNPHFDLSDIEIRRPKHQPSYTYDTVMKLKEIYGAEGEFYFIIGADCIHTLNSWYKIEKLSSMIKFVITKRPNYKFNVQELLALGLDFATLSTPELEISSTDLRQRIKQGKNIRYLMPEEVISYIRQENLYL